MQCSKLFLYLIFDPVSQPHFEEVLRLPSPGQQEQFWWQIIGQRIYLMCGIHDKLSSKTNQYILLKSQMYKLEVLRLEELFQNTFNRNRPCWIDMHTITN